MFTVEETLQRPSKRASKHAPTLPGVTDWTGLLLQHKVHSVGWVELGQVHEAARQTSIIMFTTEIAQVRNCLVWCKCVVNHNYQYFLIRFKVAGNCCHFTTVQRNLYCTLKYASLWLPCLLNFCTAELGFTVLQSTFYVLPVNDVILVSQET